MINIGMIDDDALIVSLLTDYLNKDEAITVSFTALSAESGLSILMAMDNPPQIVLLDLKMKEMSGIELTEILRRKFKTIHIIVISSHYRQSFMGFMLKTGVSAFLPKGISPQELLKIIKEVAEKGFYFKPEQLETIRGQITSKSPQLNFNSKNALSSREEDVLRLICRQKNAKEIGELLFITKRTVEGHKTNLFIKTGAKNTAGLVIFAIQNNIIDPNEIPFF